MFSFISKYDDQSVPDSDLVKTPVNVFELSY